MSFRSVRTFLVESDQAEVFERAYRDGAFLERAVTNPGFIRGELVRATVEPPVFIALAEWETEADYTAWQAGYDQLPAEPTERMFATLRPEDEPGLVGEIILTADRSTLPPTA